VTERDDDYLAKPEPFAEPHGGGLNHGYSGYAEGLRGARVERRAPCCVEKRTAMGEAFVVGAGAMGAAVVAAATFTILVFAGLFTVSSGVSGGYRPVTLVQQPPATTALPSPSDATDPAPSSDTTEALSPTTTARTGPPPLPSSERLAVPWATADVRVPAQPRSNSSGLEQPSSASSPPVNAAPAPASPMTSTPNTNPAGHAPAGRNK